MSKTRTGYCSLTKISERMSCEESAIFLANLVRKYHSTFPFIVGKLILTEVPDYRNLDLDFFLLDIHFTTIYYCFYESSPKFQNFVINPGKIPTG